jgi:hypothetical protein
MQEGDADISGFPENRKNPFGSGAAWDVAARIRRRARGFMGLS